MGFNFSAAAAKARPSSVREMQKYNLNVNLISFGGGMPAPELFPVDEINQISSKVLKEKGKVALQYSTTEGYDPLRQWIAGRMQEYTEKEYGLDHILVVQGSQQAIDLAARTFVNEGDVVLCEQPTYLAAINVFKSCKADVRSVPTDDCGIIMESLEKTLKETANVKLIYVITDYQNPTGVSWSRERREQLAEMAAKFNVVVLEDDPYIELRYEGEFIPPVKAFDKTGHVIFAGSFSKMLSPGIRMGWVTGDSEIIAKMILAKQAADLQCNTFMQMVVSEYLSIFNIDKHITEIKKLYKRRRDVMLATMDEVFPKNITYTRPNGGMFLWVTLPENMFAAKLLEKAIESNVAFVCGTDFYPDGSGNNKIRLSFSNMTEEKIVEGIKRMAKAIELYED
ncbi:MAG: PLP-dependent aminotransferase family protein [Bacillota bacterium]